VQDNGYRGKPEPKEEKHEKDASEGPAIMCRFSDDNTSPQKKYGGEPYRNHRIIQEPLPKRGEPFRVKPLPEISEELLKRLHRWSFRTAACRSSDW
jgi:hypothetical protein